MGPHFCFGCRDKKGVQKQSLTSLSKDDKFPSAMAFNTQHLKTLLFSKMRGVLVSFIG